MSNIKIKKEIKRCSRCILPETYPDIKFDENEVCHKCHEFDIKYLNKDYKKSEGELIKIFGWAKAQKKKYDCVVPFSGGKDSSYTLYLCIKKYNLKVLAVNFNNGLKTQEALNNIENIIQKMGCAFACYGPSWKTMRSLYREFFFKAGQFCFPCDAGIWATVETMAETYDVPLIVSGFSTQIESRGRKIYCYNNKLFKNVAKNLLTSEEMKDFLEVTKLDRLLGRLKRLRLTRYRRQISLPNYMIWDDKEIKEIITSELGWEKAIGKSSDHIDCLFAPVKNYLVVQKWGFGEKTTKYAAMVRAKQITRDEAIKRAMEEESDEMPEAIDKFMGLLDIKKEDLQEAKNKTHLDIL